MDASCSSASNCGIITYYKFNKMKEKVTLVVVDFQYDFCLLASLRLKGMISIEEYEYLKHLIRKENENAQRANGCTY